MNFILNEYSKRIIGIFVVFLISYIFSADRKNINWKKISMTFLSIFAFAWFFINFDSGVFILSKISLLFATLYEASGVGISFVFGELATLNMPWGFIFAIKVLPVIIFFSALISILYYIGLIQIVVYGIGRILGPVFGTTGPETLCVVANSFLAQTEAPILIRSYLKNMNESEIFTIMVAGMGTLSAGIIAVYGSIGISIEHLLISSFVSIPASIFISKIWYPNKSKSAEKTYKIDKTKEKSFFGALGNGTSDGIFLALNVGAMLIVIISLLYCLDSILLFFGSIINSFFKINFQWSLASILGIIVYPFTWLLGIPVDEVTTISNIIGLKIGVNEMIAYTKLIKMNVSGISTILATYALAGFSNFSCIGIQLSGIGSLEESTKPTIAKLGMKAVFAAALSNLLVSYVVGLFI